MMKQHRLLTFLVAAAALLILPLLLQQGGNAWVRIVDMALLYVLLALGLNIVVGYAGLLDLGYVAFFAVGAYLFALLGSPHLADAFPVVAAAFPNGLHLPIWAVIPMAAVLAACFVAVPALTVMWLVREAQVGPWMLAGAATAFVAAARAVFALPAAVLDGCGPMQALQKSIALTRGRTLTLLAVMLLLSALLCVGAVVTSLLLNMGPMGFVAAVIAQLPMFVAMVGALVAMWRACQPVPAV